MHNDSLFRVWKEDIYRAIEKATSIKEQLDQTQKRLNTTFVEVRKFYFFKERISQHEDIVNNQGYLQSYISVAYDKGYVTEEERNIAKAVFLFPYMSSLKLWLKAQEIYLSFRDFQELNNLLDYNSEGVDND